MADKVTDFETAARARARRRGRDGGGGGEGEARAKLILKIGDAEMQFEAGLDAVDERLEKVLGLFLEKARDAADAGGPGAASVSRRVLAPGPPPPGARDERANYPVFEIDPAEVAEHYSGGSARELALRGLPRGLVERERNADVLLLLLYGRLVLFGEASCFAPSLLHGARRSGLELDRASRLLERRARYVRATGRGRGRRYRLTAAGVGYCERLLRRLGEAPPPGGGIAPDR